MNFPEDRSLSRRGFVRLAGGSLVAASTGGLSGVASACGASTGPTGSGETDRNLLRLAPEVSPRGLILQAGSGTADVGGGVRASALMLNGSLPGPLLRIRQGESFGVTLQNQIGEPLILHWHGLTPPEAMDGHPRFAVASGGTYDYQFPVDVRAGTYWYHPHTHMRTAQQTYRGLAGMLIVGDAEEDALGLPSGAREIPLILQDRRLDGSGVPVYAPSGPDFMAGYMGPEPFGNGIRRPFLEVDSALYRFRILNGSNARVFRLGWSNGRPLILIGNDGGLLARPETLAFLDMGPAERADLLVDLSGSAVGDRVMLQSLAFAIPGGGGFMGGANLQGQPMDLLELRVTRRVQETVRIPSQLSTPRGPQPADSVRERSFRFTSMMMNHEINGRTFQMDRVDERVPFGDTEIWSFNNDSGLPHAVHLHATQFSVLSRTGGRGGVQPWEQGLKDTVLMYPQETVRVAVRFTSQRGLFLLHCHLLEHEDMGMMFNVLVE
jgi:FtsP/CotA-like multicopper oxidase with cupredoxin domain